MRTIYIMLASAGWIWCGIVFALLAWRFRKRV
jgi:hypothetical protein